MDTQPKIPTLKDSQKPQVKVRGLEAGVTLFDRLKQFKKKDLAFILAGLGTLFMAPLAEHFMMSPETGDANQLQAGWKGGGGKAMFDGSGSSPYEPGTTGLAPGAAVGGGSDIITPLNVRDPSALVMGPGATQQPPTSSVMPSTPPPTAPNSMSGSDLKDALAAGSRGAGAAVKAAARALMPVPKVALGGSGLHGLGAVSGGTSASAGGGGISSNGLVSGRAANNGSMAGVRGGGNIKGVTRGQSSGDSGGLDALKKAGDAAASAFNRGGANAGLNEAANTAIPTGGGSVGGNGAGGGGSTDKPFGGDQNKDGKNVGESLAFLKQKAIQEAQIALWAKEQEAGDGKLEMLKIRNSMAEAIAGKIGGAVGDSLACPITPGKGGFSGCWGSGGVTTYYCAGQVSQPASVVSTTGQAGCLGTPADGKGGGATNSKLYFTSGTDLLPCPNQSGVTALHDCQPDGTAAKSSGSSAPQTGAKDLPGGFEQQSQIKNLVGYCQQIDATNAELTKTTPAPGYLGKVSGYLTNLKTSAGILVSGRDGVYYGQTSECGASPLMAKGGGKTATDNIKDAVTKLGGAAAPSGPADAASVIGKMKGLVGETDIAKTDAGQFPDYDTAVQSYKDAKAILEAAETKLNSEYKTSVDKGGDPSGMGITDKNLPAKLTALKTQLDGIQQGLVSNLGIAKKANENLKVQLNQLGANIGKTADGTSGVQGTPILKNLVQQNKDYQDQVGYSGGGKDAKDGAEAKPDEKASKTSLSGVVGAINTKNPTLVEDVSKDAVKVTVAWPGDGTPPKVATADAVVGATGSTQKALAKLKTDAQPLATPSATVVVAVDVSVTLKGAKAETPVTANTSLTSSLTDFKDATTSRGTMRNTESAWLDSIQTGLPAANSLPQK